MRLDPSARPTSTPRELHVAELGVLVVMVFWAGNFVVVKAANEFVPPIAFAFARFAFAGLTLLAVLRLREGSWGLPRADILPIAILGGLGFGVYQILWATGLQSISAGDSSLLIAATPVLTALIAVAARSDVLTAAKTVGALVSFAGVAIVIGARDDLDLGSSLVGDGLTLGAALCWSIYTAFGAPVLRRHSPLRTTTWAIVFGAIVLAPLGIGQAATADRTEWIPLAGPILAGFLYSAVLAAGMPNVVVFHAVKLLGPTRITAFQFLVPAFAVVFAAAFLAEPVRFGQVVGGAVIVAGILLTRRDSLRLPRASARPRS